MELINRNDVSLGLAPFDILGFKSEEELNLEISKLIKARSCLLYTSDAADDLLCVDLGGRRIIKMELINRNDVSLGLAPFDILGFKSEEELNLEISKLIKARSEFDTKNKVTSN